MASAFSNTAPLPKHRFRNVESSSVEISSFSYSPGEITPSMATPDVFLTSAVTPAGVPPIRFIDPQNAGTVRETVRTRAKTIAVIFFFIVLPL